MRFFTFFLIALIFIACQEGVSPADGERESFVSGKLIVISGKTSWPSPDSAKELRIIVVPEYPPYNILADILEGRAFLSDTLPRFINTIPYQVKIQKTPMESAYILASLRFGTIIQQRMIGFYKKNLESKIPDKLYIDKGVYLKDLDIFIDFYNLPEQQPIK
ncbi:hypothetical protein D9V84_00650 [Bacteroidetes/Chlorobi group bacterium Naka2016]|jgi:hypothetical protein|nr:MAG: hypothetical protein D9V84_00650 [Bacteroidetes/Chlorobi group bacterium Naka2016]